MNDSNDKVLAVLESIENKIDALERRQTKSERKIATAERVLSIHNDVQRQQSDTDLTIASENAAIIAAVTETTKKIDTLEKRWAATALAQTGTAKDQGEILKRTETAVGNIPKPSFAVTLSAVLNLVVWIVYFVFQAMSKADPRHPSP